MKAAEMTVMDRRALKFLVVGLGNNAAFFCIFSALVWAGANVLLTASVVYVVAVLTSYAINRMWSFNSKRPHGQSLARYFAVYVAGYFVQIGLLWLLHHVFGLPAIAAQLVIMFVMAGVFFVAMETYVFPTEKQPPSPDAPTPRDYMRAVSLAYRSAA